MDTHVTFVLDSSGSMEAIRDDTIGGFNAFLTDQRNGPGHCSVSLYDFNTHVDRVYEGKSAEDAPRLDATSYRPAGQTALYDALTLAITETDAYLGAATLEFAPENVVVVVLTDGQENASETPRDHVRGLVEEFRTERGWEFVFIGANQDAALSARSMGMDANYSLDMASTGEGARSAYESTSNMISDLRRTGSTTGFTNEDRRRQQGEDGS